MTLLLVVKHESNQLGSLRKKPFGHREVLLNKAALKFMTEAKKETQENVHM